MSDKITNAHNRLALDVNASHDLREQFRKDPQAGLRAAAQQFEAMFLQMVLKSMRDATPQDGLLASDESRFYTSMLDQQLAQNMAGGRGLGFARLIEDQLGRMLPETSGGEAAGVPALPPAIGAGNAIPADYPNAGSVGAAFQPRFPAVAPVVARTAGGDAVTDGSVAGSAREFVNQVWPHAVEASRATGIPPQFLVAQAALESGWGKNEIRHADGSASFNLFGIKAGRKWSGGTVDTPTVEYVDGAPQKVIAKFRAYASYAEGFSDYANLLRNNPRFGNVVGSQDGVEFARRLQQAGYATDPAYADKLARIINGPLLRQALIG